MKGSMGLVLCAAVCCAVGSARADFRVWSSKDGASNVEANFIQMSGTKVVLEKKDGNRVMVPINKLCAKDQEYLASVIPPEFDIDVDVDVDTEKLSEESFYSYSSVTKRDSIKIDVTIKKTSKPECSREFKAHLYIVAEAMSGDGRQVIGQKKHTFSFMQSESTQFSGSAKSTYSEWSGYSSGNESGWEYEGYIVVVEDQKGNVVAVDTNKSAYENKLAVIRRGKEGDTFDL